MRTRECNSIKNQVAESHSRGAQELPCLKEILMDPAKPHVTHLESSYTESNVSTSVIPHFQPESLTPIFSLDTEVCWDGL